MKKIWILLAVLAGVGACASLPTSSENLLRADGYFADGNLEKALDYYNKAIILNPGNLEAYSSRGTAHFFAGNYNLAREDFEHVLLANPYKADVYTAYGSVLATQGAYEEALRVFDIAIMLNPSKPENFFSRAGVFFMTGQYQKAITDYTSVINLRPAAEVYNARGAVYSYIGDTQRAEQDFKTAKEDPMPATLQVYRSMHSK